MFSTCLWNGMLVVAFITLIAGMPAQLLATAG
jgi:hypothetical protein